MTAADRKPLSKMIGQEWAAMSDQARQKFEFEIKLEEQQRQESDLVN